ncbi:uncharacterized protein LOC129608504 [Condylostylus longicornis]|uniref:uncharacterized protein LOC129608504 n=1 Tax=Condylostylus longicornis TaxID=2530218 RepID=UPI00244DC6BB|nr:uncharacterized protein LOC129608504 [Condylostylus longicornis]
MVALDNLILILNFLVASFVQGNALQCWQCSSKTEGHEEFCGEKLIQNKISEKLEKTGLLTQNCSKFETHGHNTDETQNLIAVCRKKILKVNEETIYQRHCDFVDKRAKESTCKREKIAENSRIIDCEDCTTDYCNNSNSIIPSLLPYIVSILIAKFLSN